MKAIDMIILYYKNFVCIYDVTIILQNFMFCDVRVLCS
jgi:hypothetical protein